MIFWEKSLTRHGYFTSMTRIVQICFPYLKKSEFPKIRKKIETLNCQKKQESFNWKFASMYFVLKTVQTVGCRPRDETYRGYKDILIRFRDASLGAEIPYLVPSVGRSQLLSFAVLIQASDNLCSSRNYQYEDRYYVHNLNFNVNSCFGDFVVSKVYKG